MIGAGRVGMALAVLLERANHRVVAAVGGEDTRERVRRYLRWTTFLPVEQAVEAARKAKVVVLAVPDDRVAEVCETLGRQKAFRFGQRVIHLSGSVGLAALLPAAQREAMILSLHPLQTFPDVDTGIERVPGSAIAVTARTAGGFAFGESLARDIGGVPFHLPDEAKPLYHAAAVFCSNYLVVVQGMAEHLFRLAGVPDPVRLFAPLALSSLDSAIGMGPLRALTGPAARGDAGTIARNLAALNDQAPEAIPAYVALAAQALQMAVESGRITEAVRKEAEEVLERWR